MDTTQSAEIVESPTDKPHGSNDVCGINVEDIKITKQEQPDVYLNVPAKRVKKPTHDHNDETDFKSKAAYERSMSVISRASTVLEAKPLKPREYKLKAFIALLFCIIVSSVIVIYHFYNRHVYYLELGQRVYFDEIERTLRVTDEDGNEVLRGELGLTLPDHMLPMSCDSHSDSCIEWKDNAQVHIDYEQSSHIHCYHIKWTSQGEYTYPYDCFDLGDAHWYGGILPAQADFQDLHYDRKALLTSTVNNVDGFGPVVEPFWLTSKNVAIYVEGAPPLHLELNQENDGRFCLASLYVESPYENSAGVSPSLNYTVCTASNLRDMHKYMLARFTPKSEQPPPNKFSAAVYSTWANFKDDLSQQGILDYVQTIVDDNMPKGIILLQEGWQSAHGDLTFDTNKFPNASDMISQITSHGFEVAVAVTHMVATDSQAFQHRLTSSSLAKDAGGVTEGLVNYYTGPHTPQWHQTHAAALDFSSPNIGAPFDDVKTRLGVQHMMYEGGQVDLLPYRAHFTQAFATLNEYTAVYYDQAADDWSNMEAAYRNQNMLHFLQLYDSNSTVDRNLNGLQSVLPNAIASGIMGYPLFVPSSIGGSYYADKPNDRLYKRWAQLVSFLPVLHYSILPGDYGQLVVDQVNRYALIHSTEVIPAIERLLANVTTHLYPIVRPLWWYDPSDKNCVHIYDQFMVGDYILVAPILDDSSVQRDIYLPKGRWLYQKDSEMTYYDGPQYLDQFNADYDTIPYFKLTSQ